MGWSMHIDGPLCIESGKENVLEPWWERGYTHNCNPMIRRALAEVGELESLGEEHLYSLDGRSCSEIGPLLAKAMEWWEHNRAILREMNPANGWGDESSAFEFWGDVTKQCLDNPTGTLRAWG